MKNIGVRKSIQLRAYEKLSRLIILYIRKSPKTPYERSLFCLNFHERFLIKNGYKNLLIDDLYYGCY